MSLMIRHEERKDDVGDHLHSPCNPHPCGEVILVKPHDDEGKESVESDSLKAVKCVHVLPQVLWHKCLL